MLTQYSRLAQLDLTIFSQHLRSGSRSRCHDGVPVLPPADEEAFQLAKLGREEEYQRMLIHEGLRDAVRSGLPEAGLHSLVSMLLTCGSATDAEARDCGLTEQQLRELQHHGIIQMRPDKTYVFRLRACECYFQRQL